LRSHQPRFSHKAADPEGKRTSTNTANRAGSSTGGQQEWMTEQGKKSDCLRTREQQKEKKANMRITNTRPKYEPGSVKECSHRSRGQGISRSAVRRETIFKTAKNSAVRPFRIGDQQGSKRARKEIKKEKKAMSPIEKGKRGILKGEC